MISFAGPVTAATVAFAEVTSAAPNVSTVTGHVQAKLRTEGSGDGVELSLDTGKDDGDALGRIAAEDATDSRDGQVTKEAGHDRGVDGQVTAKDTTDTGNGAQEAGHGGNIRDGQVTNGGVEGDGGGESAKSDGGEDRELAEEHFVLKNVGGKESVGWVRWRWV